VSSTTSGSSARPREYNFGAGLPDPATFPGKELAAAAARVLPQIGSMLARYPDPRGYVPLREIAQQRFARNHGMAPPIEEIVLTAGSMQALGLLAQAFIKPSEPVVVEEFTYSGTLSAFRRHGADLVGVPLDDDGMRMDALDDALTRLEREGRPARFVYTIASHQNPTGSIMPEARRRELLEIARRHDVLVVEDDCYADVRFSGEAAPALYKMAEPGRVLYIGSFSKILGPGVRLGYFIAPEALGAKLLMWKIDGGTSNLAAMIVAEYFREHLWTHIAEVSAAIKVKRDTVLAALQQELGDAISVRKPEGGLFLWVKLPDTTDVPKLIERARARGVICAAGRSFYYADKDIPYIRLAFGYPAVEEIPQGIAELAAAVREAQVPAAPAAR
jgi:2-aminoadipate transaminase